MSSLYQAAIIDAARRATGHGRLAHAQGSAAVDNPLCGDRVTVDVGLDAGGCVDRIGHEVRGCLLCEAAAALVAEIAPGRSPDALRADCDTIEAAMRGQAAFPWPELDVFEPVRAVRSRHRCVILPFEALRAAIDQSLEAAD